MNDNKKFVIKLSLILFAIVFISVFLLSLTNLVTKDIIDERSQITEQESRKNVMPNADDFKQIKDFDFDNEDIKEAYAALSNNNTIGYCFNVTTKGYGGDINMIIGVNSDGSVEGVNIVSMSETAGLGAKTQNSEFLDQYKGLKENIEVVKNSDVSNNSVNAVSGATISSKAVTKGVNSAISAVKQIIEGGK